MEAEAYLTLAARYETPLFSYAARMLGGLGDGERCLRRARWRSAGATWTAAPSRRSPQTWLYTLVRESCFDELARRAPATTGEDDLGSVERLRGAGRGRRARRACGPPIATCCCCATCTGSTRRRCAP